MRSNLQAKARTLLLARRYAAFSRCSAALAVSGSVTAQLAAARLPAVVAYRAHALTEARAHAAFALLTYLHHACSPLRLTLLLQWLALRRAAVRHVALPNLVLRREAVPEAVFAAATPSALAGHLATLLGDPAAREAQRLAAAQFLAAVAPPGAAACAAAGGAEPRLPSQVAAEAVLRSVGEHLARVAPEEGPGLRTANGRFAGRRRDRPGAGTCARLPTL